MVLLIFIAGETSIIGGFLMFFSRVWNILKS